CLRRVISTGLMGLFLSYLYEKSGTIALPILVHGFSNSIQPLLEYPLINMIPITPGARIASYWSGIFVQICAIIFLSLLSRKCLQGKFKTDVIKPWKIILLKD
ncbi:MAG: CPBP family glutamic-type intramembrane protease, partial [Promethearchaeota archaeon]